MRSISSSAPTSTLMPSSPSTNGTGISIKFLHIKSKEQCLASPELLTPPPPLHPACPPPAPKAGGTHSPGGEGGGGVNILEDARPWIGLLQYNPSTGISLKEDWRSRQYHVLITFGREASTEYEPCWLAQFFATPYMTVCFFSFLFIQE